MLKVYNDKKMETYYGEKTIENDVLIFTDDEKIKQIVKKVTKSLKLNLLEARDTVDLYTIRAFCMIIDPDNVDPDYFENFEEIHELENPKEFVVVLTKPIKLARSIQKYFIVAQFNGKLESQLRTMMLNRRSNIISRKTDPKVYTKKLNRLFVILRHLQKEGDYIKITEMAEEFAVSEKTIKRDISYLREVGGEDIKYDMVKKGYYLDNSFNSNIVTRFDSEIH